MSGGGEGRGGLLQGETLDEGDRVGGDGAAQQPVEHLRPGERLVEPVLARL